MAVVKTEDRRATSATVNGAGTGKEWRRLDPEIK